MKTKLTFLALILFSFVNAQIYTPDNAIQGTSGNNNVGIGINAPQNKLDVYGSHGDSRILLHSAGGGDIGRQADLMLWASEPGLTYTGVGIGNNIHNFNNVNGGLRLLNPVKGGSYLRLLDNSLSLNVVSPLGSDKQALSINSDGNIGISTANAQNKLQIGDFNYGGITKISIPGIYNFEEMKLGQYGNGANGLEMITHSSQSTSFGIRLFASIDSGMSGLLIQTADAVNSSQNLSYSTKLAVNINGNVGIGTITPDAKLAVNGTIHSKEVKVDMNGWSDFVFKRQYILPTLEEVEKHIAEKGHLKNIPSEEEVLKNGINLGEMNTKLLQKIEELTLYMIEMKKENQALKNAFEKQNKEIEFLKIKSSNQK